MNLESGYMIDKVFKRNFLIIFLVFTLISVSSINILGIEGKVEYMIK